jgi:hypothetical protein
LQINLPRGAQAAVEGRDVTILLRLAGIDVMPLNLVVVCPFQDRIAGQFCSVTPSE